MGTHHWIERCAVGERHWLTTKHTIENLRSAARNSCSLKTAQVAKWLPNSIVPFQPLKMYGNPGEKNVSF